MRDLTAQPASALRLGQDTVTTRRYVSACVDSLYRACLDAATACAGKYRVLRRRLNRIRVYRGR
ncbi:hypothetical protein K466DRAFT_580817 [Polyporus arcularius HHB13444]|uniref:Uncharacterized protein n=1 Tax=Polyporus arcularius HHB13444 TaxID=1314778 RepID=A0A5C3PXV1_9APHY|nr:hypothetical protein K466DRAFT_580817 [Polyporus arcularius HHB13444]